MTNSVITLLTDKRIVVTGGTGSLGRVLVRRLIAGELGVPSDVIVFSRDEAKQHSMRLEFQHRAVATDEVLYGEGDSRLSFRLGDVSDFASIAHTLRGADVVFHAAAMKQVPACEYHPFEAVKTNVAGAENIVRAIREHGLQVETVVGVTTDKACKPVNVMGMTKALQERILARANLDEGATRFVTARYGNVLASRGSVIPLFHEQIRRGGPLTLTSVEMTRFLLSLDDAVDTVFAALRDGRPGETYVPRVSAVRLSDLATALIGERDIAVRVTGVRPGEKTHEILVSEEESVRTIVRGQHLAIGPILPELRRDESSDVKFDGREYSSADALIDPLAVAELLRTNRLRVEDAPVFHV
jgi:UDP-glucose 4-epimerase